MLVMLDFMTKPSKKSENRYLCVLLVRKLATGVLNSNKYLEMALMSGMCLYLRDCLSVPLITC